MPLPENSWRELLAWLWPQVRLQDGLCCCLDCLVMLLRWSRLGTTLSGRGSYKLVSLTSMCSGQALGPGSPVRLPGQVLGHTPQPGSRVRHADTHIQQQQGYESDSRPHSRCSRSSKAIEAICLLSSLEPPAPKFPDQTRPWASLCRLSALPVSQLRGCWVAVLPGLRPAPLVRRTGRHSPQLGCGSAPCLGVGKPGSRACKSPM